jgi:hypothetical protein
MSTMATTGDEIAVGYRWIMDRLRADTGPGGLRQTGSPAWVSGIHQDEAPQGAGPPYVVVSYQAGDPVAADVGANEIMATCRFLVRAVVGGVDTFPAVPINERIHARLQLQRGSFGSGTVLGEVLMAVRRGLISYVEGTGSEPRYRNHGGEYELTVQSA